MSDPRNLIGAAQPDSSLSPLGSLRESDVKARLYTDGGARGNPGLAAYGFVLEAEDGTVLAAEGEAIGTATNNFAEYSGLVAGLRRALELHVPELEVVSDSELMVKQMRGEYRVKNEALRELSTRRRALARRLASRVSPREARAQRARRPARQRGAGRRVNVSHPVRPRDRGRRRGGGARDDRRRHRVPQPGGAQALPRQGAGRRDPAARRDGLRELPLHDEWRDGRTTILFFEANVGDRDLQGIDILEENEAGEIEKFTVMIRPLSGLQAVAGTMAARLGLA